MSISRRYRHSADHVHHHHRCDVFHASGVICESGHLPVDQLSVGRIRCCKLLHHPGGDKEDKEGEGVRHEAHRGDSTPPTKVHTGKRGSAGCRPWGGALLWRRLLASGVRSAVCHTPALGRWSKVTVELGQHATAVGQHACLDEEVKGDSGGTCDEETEVFSNPTRGVGPTLEPHPFVALPRLSTGGEKNAPDGSKLFKPVQPTLVGPPPVAFMVTEASGDQQRPKVDPKPHRDKDGEEVRVVMTAPYQAFKPTHSFYSIRPIDTDDLEQEQSQCATAGATDESIHCAANQFINTSSWTRCWFITNTSSWTRRLQSEPLLFRHHTTTH
ncbi:uncharacterized protein LOC130519972 [Takifugu flavidus]|uniref:uncharacterized protein LOC130519972 n=1 Tax=Takifugu flavidus TaxID=433684 RepID=UPI00254466C3|nr:uncharacterized protein LOC130519972 [Takifugu flavidus]